MHVKIGNTWVGEGHPCYVVAEIGINHNGDLKAARELIRTAKDAGCNAVKFQKRTVDVVYSAEELAKPRESPWGTTNGDQKRGLEFGENGYIAIDEWCKKDGIAWFASCWDEASVDFIDHFDPPAYKIASASLTDDALLWHTRSKGKPIILSTGMSTTAQIDHAVEMLGADNLILLHTVSVYPAAPDELNLRRIGALKERYPMCLQRTRDRAGPVTRGGHSRGLHGGASHNVGSQHVRQRPSGLTRTGRTEAPRPQHPHDRSGTWR
jgi:N-acetylneuraminate synthase